MSLSDGLSAEAMAKSMERGILTGERAVLARQLERHLGDLSREIRTRLGNANQEQLEIWADRILDTETLEQVIQDH